jgi:hypothetical protein
LPDACNPMRIISSITPISSVRNKLQLAVA